MSRRLCEAILATLMVRGPGRRLLESSTIWGGGLFVGFSMRFSIHSVGRRKYRDERPADAGHSTARSPQRVGGRGLRTGAFGKKGRRASARIGVGQRIGTRRIVGGGGGGGGGSPVTGMYIGSTSIFKMAAPGCEAWLKI